MAIEIFASTPQSEPFIRPKFDVSKPTTAEQGYLQTLPDLVELNATYNRDHLFCAQYGHDIHAPPHFITHGDLYQAVLRSSAWLASQGLAQRPQHVGGKVVKSRPVAMLMSSDVTWFIIFLSLLRLGVPVLCMSARLSPQAVVHLVKKTDAKAILASPQLDSWPLTGEYEGPVPIFHQVPPYAEFLDPSSSLDPDSVPPPPRYVDNEDRNVVILHSSGTTGLPKPIFHSHAYLLGYCACHQLTPEQVQDAVNVSTLPLFHGFGLLAPSLSLSIGLPFALPASTTIPTGTSTYEILRLSGATSLLTVPSILEEIYLLDDNRGVEALKRLNFVAVGGAPMKLTVAEALSTADVPILNHWGVTEIGAIAPIVIPGADYDWHYLRVRDDLDLRFEPLSGEQAGFFRLTGRPPLAADDFAVQDLLVCNPTNPTREFRIAGRADDLIVLATGEKVRPHALEQRVAEHPFVRGALAFGDGRFQLGLLVEAAPHVPLDVTDAAAVRAYVDAVWPAVAAGNEGTDHHARVSREMLVVTHPAVLPLVRTPKGSIPRGPNVQVFKEQIDALYARADVAEAEPLPLGEPEELRAVVRRAVLAAYTTPRALADAEDLFERGMDSLQATMLRRRLNAAVALAAKETGKTIMPLPLDVVYANPSIELLYNAIRVHCGEGSMTQDRIVHMKSVAAEYVQKVSQLRPATEVGLVSANGEGAVVLLTGSSGSLGSAILYELASSPDVTKVYALNRVGRKPLRERQEESLQKLGVKMDGLWEKVELLEGDLGTEQFKLSEETYTALRQVSHIIHNAWPMDFNRSLTSFRPHLEASKHVLQLALDSTSTTPVKLLFSSSIAVVGRYPLVTGSSAPIPETPLADPRAVDHFGYAEAKWVCEQMFARAAEQFADRVVVNSVRIGQMTGAEATGAWNAAEHFPMIVKSCRAVGRVPAIEGHASWVPVNRAAKVMSELLFGARTSGTLHMENPSRQPWTVILRVIASALGVPSDEFPPYAEWLQKVKADSDAATNPCVKIIPFLEDEFLRMATGQVVLDTAKARELSPTLDASVALSEEHIRAYIEYWKQEQLS
ncbi:uncharacterized protein PHACADRAFT_125794 [Phanerochaete carnosa HHB-10118-sp]|uniref:Carrier domain-containing protein n=1 Tax=Phanerochaete carnosa (strain HHB-10118-sp) TaxID=650164 RepID=K5W4H1_PHACS|nr:uncharacterized protein PHACADRAFT_125794 [Phanerochaete carnosa HHB-10118-sp]EKM53824.1 hypothetical protein PHACADRAFT_125794 [Phanerochaete carnosa HHB-10118-sp]